MILALTFWLGASIITTGIVARFLWACAQADKQAADDAAESDRAVLLQEFNPISHAASNTLGKE